MRLKIYKDGTGYITGGVLSIEPTDEPVEEYDLSDLTKDEIKLLEKNKNDKKLRKKMIKL